MGGGRANFNLSGAICSHLLAGLVITLLDWTVGDLFAVKQIHQKFIHQINQVKIAERLRPCTLPGRSIGSDTFLVPSY